MTFRQLVIWALYFLTDVELPESSTHHLSIRDRVYYARILKGVLDAIDLNDWDPPPFDPPYE